MSKKSVRIIVVSLFLIAAQLLSACGFLDNAINKGFDKGFGNNKPCSGLVC